MGYGGMGEAKGEVFKWPNSSCLAPTGDVQTGGCSDR